MTGCGANLDGDQFAGLPQNVIVVRRRSEETAAFVAADVGALGCVQDDERLDRVRAFVKIQDGCSFSCNFCVIPLVRGGTRSRSADAVLREIRKRVAQGHREVVLTGINLGCFRDRAAGFTLARLVREAGETPGLARLRLSSIEVNHLTDELVAALRETPAASRHLHVPLQSGDDRDPARDGPPLLRRDVPRAARGLQPDRRRDRRLPRRGRGRLRRDAAHSRGCEHHEGACLPVLAPARNGHRPGADPVAQEKKERRNRLRAASQSRASRAGARRLAGRTSCSSTVPDAVTATTTPPGSSEPEIGQLVESAPLP